jgi:hypothetical protein
MSPTIGSAKAGKRQDFVEATMFIVGRSYDATNSDHFDKLGLDWVEAGSDLSV